MDALIILLPVSIGTALLFLFLFLRAASSGQFEDLDDVAIRVIQDD